MNDVIVEHGERRCLTCGMPHNARSVELDPRPDKLPTYGITWNDPEDNHPYNPEPWEAVARRLSAESGLPIT